MKHVWEQKKKIEFITYKDEYAKGGKLMTKEDQIARFYTIYNKMSASDQECLKEGMINLLAARIGFAVMLGIAFGIVIGHLVW